MSDQEDNREGKVADAAELRLARELRALPRTMAPERDLWAGIERKILDYPQRRRVNWTRDWMPYGVAASLLIAVAALGISVLQGPGPEPTYASFERSMDGLQADYLAVRNPMVEQFKTMNQGLDPVVLEDLQRNLEILAVARREIEQQVRANPQDQKLVEMLMSIHEQELELLKQNFTRRGRSL
ncbi:MAG: hypothetical protein ACFHX7_03965 [Pseudomonadota bacterium]